VLEFERTVSAPDGGPAVSVFVDKDKGHVVYLANTGTMVVMDSDKTGRGATRAAGFAVGDKSCGGCEGC
jgi:hypothetical protein